MSNEVEAIRPRRKGFHVFGPKGLRLVEVAVVLLILNLFVVGALLWRVETNKPPVIATVGVTQLSRVYSQQFAADPSNSPEMISLKTRIFMATTEKFVGQIAKQRGMVVFARECVLTGDHVDLTPEITASVDQALKAGQLPMGEGANGQVTMVP